MWRRGWQASRTAEVDGAFETPLRHVFEGHLGDVGHAGFGAANSHTELRRHRGPCEESKARHEVLDQIVDGELLAGRPGAPVVWPEPAEQRRWQAARTLRRP